MRQFRPSWMWLLYATDIAAIGAVLFVGFVLAVSFQHTMSPPLISKIPLKGLFACFGLMIWLLWRLMAVSARPE